MDDIAFDMARISAIKAYGGLESIVATLISHTLKVQTKTAWSIMYRVSNTRARYAIISDAFKTNYPEYKKAWSVIERWLSKIDTQRNHIVHWITVTSPQPNGRTEYYLTNPATFLGNKDEQLTYSFPEMAALAFSANQMHDVVLWLTVLTKGPNVNEPYRDIYLQLTNDQTLDEFHSNLMTIIQPPPPRSSRA